jgi:hypothetical protein
MCPDTCESSEPACAPSPARYQPRRCEAVEDDFAEDGLRRVVVAAQLTLERRVTQCIGEELRRRIRDDVLVAVTDDAQDADVE